MEDGTIGLTPAGAGGASPTHGDTLPSMSPSKTTVPARIAWAVDLLDVRPGDEILEFGCGPGVAVALVCELLGDGDGRITAIDRSATAIERTGARNADHAAAGRAVLRQVDLAGFDGSQDTFDKAFAVNVNVFWTSPAEAECAVLRRVLQPGGIVRLVYGDGPPGQTRDVASAIAATLARHGFTTEVIRSPQGLLCVAGRLTP